MNDAAILTCTLSAWEGEPDRCRWCNNIMGPRRSRWCSNDCSYDWWCNHTWSAASSRAKRIAGFRCTRCPATRRLETHHRDPILGRHAETGCLHHQDGLVVLCVPCHNVEHVALRRRKALQLTLEVVTIPETVWDRLAASRQR